MNKIIKPDKPDREIIKWLIHNGKTRGKNDEFANSRHYGIGQICDELKISNTTPYYNHAQKLEPLHQIKIHEDGSIELHPDLEVFFNISFLKDVMTDEFIDLMLSPKKYTMYEAMIELFRYIFSINNIFSLNTKSKIKKDNKKIDYESISKILEKL